MVLEALPLGWLVPTTWAVVRENTVTGAVVRENNTMTRSCAEREHRDRGLGRENTMVMGSWCSARLFTLWRPRAERQKGTKMALVTSFSHRVSFPDISVTS